MRYKSRDNITFKVYFEAEIPYIYRLRGDKLCNFLTILLPDKLTATINIVPSQRKDRRDGYSMRVYCEKGQFKVGEMFKHERFLPVKFWPLLRKVSAKHELEVIEAMWEEFKECSRTDFLDCMKDCKIEKLRECGVEEWANLLEDKAKALEAVGNAKSECKADGLAQPAMKKAQSYLEYAFDLLERENFGDVEFSDYCPIKEHERP